MDRCMSDSLARGSERQAEQMATVSSMIARAVAQPSVSTGIWTDPDAILRLRRWTGLYLIAVVLAEIASSRADPTWGILVHLGILGCIVIACARGENAGVTTLGIALMIAPVVRIVSLTVPMNQTNGAWWILVASIPLWGMLIGILSAIPLPARTMGLRLPNRGHIPLTVATGLSGIGIGLLHYELVRPFQLSDELISGGIVVSIVGLIVVTGVLEEVLYRGVLQHVCQQALGRWSGILLGSLIFGALHIGQGSAANVLFMIGVGLFFGLLVQWTRSISGSVVAHSAASVTSLIILPQYFS